MRPHWVPQEGWPGHRNTGLMAGSPHVRSTHTPWTSAPLDRSPSSTSTLQGAHSIFPGAERHRGSF